MINQLIVTKLHIPQLRPARVIRQRLRSRLQEGVGKKLVLISAPAGYGKTTLISDWVTGNPNVAWLTVDKEDNESVRFWAYVLAGLQRVLSSRGSRWPDVFTNLDHPPDEAFLTELINVLDECTEPLTLVLDDYHHIHSQVIHDGVLFLLAHAPSHFHLIIATRADPPLSLAKFRARAEITEVRQADLCFSEEEAAEFLGEVMGIPISSEDVTCITNRTEGWIAGLQMAALSLQNTEDISGFIASLTGSHHYIFDYLLEEILERQPPEVRHFLLFTSILEQMTASLCDTLLGGGPQESVLPSAETILVGLERANLFIQPLDHERHWYRYHALFADLLRGYLQRIYADRIPILQARASEWFEKQGLIPDAIQHALAAGDWEGVVRLISANVFALLEQRELNTVIRQLDHLADKKDEIAPWLRIGQAWLAAYTGQFASVKTILKEIETEIHETTDLEHEQSLRGHSAAIRAFCAWVLGERQTATYAAREALDNLPESDQMLRCQSATILGLSCDDLDEREQIHALAIEYTRGIHGSHVVIFAYGCQAFLFLLQGKLHKAYDTCKQAIQIANSSQTLQPFPSLSHVYSTLSEIHREWNNLDKAVYYAREAVSLARRWEQVDALHYAYTNLGDALFAVGHVEEAFKTLEHAKQVAHRTSKWFEEITLSQEIKWRLVKGELEIALQCLHHAKVDIACGTGSSYTTLIQLSVAEVLLAMKQYSQAMTHIAFAMEDLEKRKNVYVQIRMSVQQALGYYHLGERTLAFESLKKAILVAAPEGCIRSFQSSDETLVLLLHQIRAEGIAPDYVNKLLAFIEGNLISNLSHLILQKGSQTKTAPGLVDPLSVREMEVLTLLAQGYADKNIADKLIIARETVHKHLKNIYEKLGVHSRTEAVARSRELGLL